MKLCIPLSEDGLVDASKRGILQQGASGYLLGQELISTSQEGKNSVSLLLKDPGKQKPLMLPNRMKISLDIPSHEMLMAVKHKKKVLHVSFIKSAVVSFNSFELQV